MIIQLQTGDCCEMMRALPAESIGAVISDPPYGLEFMGMDWETLKPDPNVGKMSNSGFSKATEGPNRNRPNYGASANLRCLRCGRWIWNQESRKCQCPVPDLPNFKAIQNRAIQEWHKGWLSECHRVLKHGGLIKAFSSPRLFHRLAAAMQSVGFDILRIETWAYGSGFPKNHDVARAINERLAGLRAASQAQGREAGTDPAPSSLEGPEASPGALFDGYGTALKSCWEPFVVGVKG